MEKYQNPLDHLFQALADPTRRAILARLGSGDISVGELAKPFDMTLPSFMKHLRLLEGAGWIRTRKSGRVRTCALETKPFDALDAWMAGQRRVWEGRTDRLERFVTSPQKKEPFK